MVSGLSAFTAYVILQSGRTPLPAPCYTSKRFSQTRSLHSLD
jgi:hypothetical protein